MSASERPSRSWGEAAAGGGICRTPSCHSRDDVEIVTIRSPDGGETNNVLLCVLCRKYYLGVSS